MLKSIVSGLSVLTLVMGANAAFAAGGAPIKIDVHGETARLAATTSITLTKPQIQATGTWVAPANKGSAIVFTDREGAYGSASTGPKTVNAWAKVTQPGFPTQEITGPAKRIGKTNQFRMNIATAENQVSANGNTSKSKGLQVAQNTDDPNGTTVQIEVATYEGPHWTQENNQNLVLPAADINLATQAVGK